MSDMINEDAQVATGESAESRDDPIAAEPGGRAVPPDVVGGDEQAELELGITSTGNESVDAALLGLAGLADRPVEEHPLVFEDVHKQLHSVLTEPRDD